MYKILLLLFACGSLFASQNLIQPKQKIRHVYVSVPSVNGGAGPEASDGRKLSPLQEAGRAISQIMGDNIGKSYTGLSLEEEQAILSNIDLSKIQRGEHDTLWTTISNAYIRSYPKLFRMRNQ